MNWTVKELINRLLDMPMDAEVICHSFTIEPYDPDNENQFHYSAKMRPYDIELLENGKVRLFGCDENDEQSELFSAYHAYIKAKSKLKPRRKPKTTLGARINECTKSALQRYADDNKITLSDLINNILDDYVGEVD